MNGTPTAHVFDEFPLLLSGEADRSTVFRVSAHLRECDDCKDELVEAVTAHATLLSAARQAPDVATGGRLAAPAASAPRVPLPSAPPVGSADVPDLLAGAADATPDPRPVDLSSVFAQIRREAAETAPGGPTGATAAPADVTAADAPRDISSARSATARGRHLRRGLVAAAAVVVLGGGGALAATELRGDGGRSITVGAFGAGATDASARIGDGWVDLNASKLPSPGDDHFYEVWLVDASRTKLLALGPLGGDRTGTYRVPAAVMNTFDSIQVTLQQNNGSPAPSDTSVLRGTF